MSEASAQTVKEAIDTDILDAAAEADVDVDEIIQRQIQKNDGYPARTVARYAQSDIQNAIEAANAEHMDGIIIGERDAYGTGIPRTYTVLRSTGEHVAIKSFSGDTTGPAGETIPIPSDGQAATLRVTWDSEYENYEVQQIDRVESFDPGDLIENLRGLALDPADLTKGHEGDVVVVEGEIGFVSAESEFSEDGERVGEHPIMAENERGGLHPRLEISLDGGGVNSVRGHLDRQAYCRPYIDVPAFERIVTDAYQDYDDPSSQAEHVGTGLRGERVVMVGECYKVNSTRSDDDPVTYVEIGITALVATSGQQTLDAVEDEAGEDEDEVRKGETVAVEEPSSDVIDETAALIDQYHSVAKSRLETVEQVREKTDIDAPDAAVRAALDRLAEDEAEEEEEPDVSDEVHGYDDLPFDPNDHTVRELRDLVDEVDDKETLVNLRTAEKKGKDRKTAMGHFEARAAEIDEADEEPDEPAEPETPWERIESGDTYNCPGEMDGEECLHQAGSTGEMMEHIIDDHGFDGNPVDFVEEHAG